MKKGPKEKLKVATQATSLCTKILTFWHQKIQKMLYEPAHDKAYNKTYVQPGKTQISLHILTVW